MNSILFDIIKINRLADDAVVWMCKPQLETPAKDSLCTTATGSLEYSSNRPSECPHADWSA